MVFLLLSLLSGACEGPKGPAYENPAEEQFAYFPLELGKFIEYKVDSIVYDFGANGASVKSEISVEYRDEVIDTLRDELGRLKFIVERSERKTATEPWTFKYLFSRQRTENQAITDEENLRFLTLVFPLDRRSAWNGHLWIDAGQEITLRGETLLPFGSRRFEVDSIDVPAQAGSFLFDSTLVVTEVDDVNIIEKRFSRIRYAKGVGPVSIERWILDSQYCNQTPPPADCETRPWELKAEKGYILRQSIIRFN